MRRRIVQALMRFRGRVRIDMRDVFAVGSAFALFGGVAVEWGLPIALIGAGATGLVLGLSDRVWRWLG